MALQWIAVELNSGKVLADLPNLVVDQSLKQTISQYDSAAVTLPVVGSPGPPKNWMRITEPYKTAIIALDGPLDGVNLPQPVWGGITQQRQRSTDSISASVPLATAESFLTRRFIRDTLQYPAVSFGICQVATDLLTRYVNIADGPLFRTAQLDVGVGQDVGWQDSDDKSLYSVFQDLGFEWTVTWEWRNTTTEPTLNPVLTYGTRLGRAVTPGLGPAVTFDYPGNLQTAAILEDYTDGKGANDVMATSTGSGEVRPQSDHQVFGNLDERPRLEYRYSAGTSIVSLAALNGDALTSLANLQGGSTGITLTALYGRAPQFGRDWNLGDDIGYDIQGPMFPEHPQGVVRAVGVSFDNDTFSPVLAGQS